MTSHADALEDFSAGRIAEPPAMPPRLRPRTRRKAAGTAPGAGPGATFDRPYRRITGSADIPCDRMTGPGGQPRPRALSRRGRLERTSIRHQLRTVGDRLRDPETHPITLVRLHRDAHRLTERAAAFGITPAQIARDLAGEDEPLPRWETPTPQPKRPAEPKAPPRTVGFAIPLPASPATPPTTPPATPAELSARITAIRQEDRDREAEARAALEARLEARLPSGQLAIPSVH